MKNLTATQIAMIVASTYVLWACAALVLGKPFVYLTQPWTQWVF